MTDEDKRQLLFDLKAMRSSILALSDRGTAASVGSVLSAHAISAQNLLHYLAFRAHDYRAIQDKLSEVGLSSLRAAESHVLDGLNKVISWLDPQDLPPMRANLNGKQAAAVLHQKKCELFKLGRYCPDRLIMVTVDASQKPEVATLQELIATGMNCARVNTGHDDARQWRTAIAAIREASQAAGEPCAVYLDLSGPKIRVNHLLNKHGDGKERIKVEAGDHFLLINKGAHTNSPKLPVVQISFDGVLELTQVGQRVLIDDGVIAGTIVSKEDHAALVEIQRTKGKGERKLKLQNGIAFPGLVLPLEVPSPADLKALDELATEVDIVGISFVQCATDVRKVVQLIKEKGWNHLGVVAKIETRSAFDNLPEILLALMEAPHAGVMIARGDLALEVGMARLAEVQEEILWMCEAATMPVIWATQVLDNLTREGVPTRAEITDAAMSVHAECVMLNKGAYIKESVAALRQILDKMRHHHNKKASEMRRLEVAGNFFDRIHQPTKL
jgi:pyruvate kinase